MDNTLEKENMCAGAMTSAELEREEEPIYEEMAPLQGQRVPLRVLERAKCIGPMLEREGVSMLTLATIVHTAGGKLDPDCCPYCFNIAYYKEFRDDCSDDDDDEPDSGHSSEHEIFSEEDEGDTPTTPPPTPMRSEEQADPLEVDAKKILCVTELFPDVWQGAVDLTLLAKLVQGELNPECCSRCELIELFRSTAASGPEGARAMSKITVIAMKGVNEHVVLKPDLHKDEKTQD
ncbi:uncharacterized protein LOC125433792 [Sphaerodactylus townsendi]|uniref:uncharacterized protein LOC125433792 n=1 Tax=Sphaerodactylus townsendi TaxID=933632 RepID=UPI002026E0C3|nr:uncharacterized protein LOC125433792 [Sphaerodactylus townsendi]